MIVDLERNDLGRICDYGTVKPSGPAAIERFSNVIHLVSTVSGRLKEDVTPVDCLMAAFPGGSITGAPKVRAMEIIEELEPVQRGPYAGLVGYLSYTGSFDSCITIRSMVCLDKKVYLQAGAGIVYDSVPEREYEETLNKARALFTACAAGGEH